MGASCSGPANEEAVKKKEDDGHVKHHFKVLILGGANVGVTALSHRYVKHEYYGDYEPSAKVGIGVKVIYDNDKRIELELWDIPSHPAIKELMRDMYMEKVDGVVVVTDTTDLTSFTEVEEWMTVFAKSKPNPMNPSLPDFPVIMMANKADSPDTKVSEDDVAYSVQQYNLQAGFLVSACKDTGLDEAFGFLIDQMLEARSTASAADGEPIQPVVEKETKTRTSVPVDRDELSDEKEEQPVIAIVEEEKKKVKAVPVEEVDEVKPKVERKKSKKKQKKKKYKIKAKDHGD